MRPCLGWLSVIRAKTVCFGDAELAHTRSSVTHASTTGTYQRQAGSIRCDMCPPGSSAQHPVISPSDLLRLAQGTSPKPRARLRASRVQQVRPEDFDAPTARL